MRHDCTLKETAKKLHEIKYDPPVIHSVDGLRHFASMSVSLFTTATSASILIAYVKYRSKCSLSNLG